LPTVAKELLRGQRVVLVRCEAILITGSLIRNKFKYARFLDKTTRTNPVRGPHHFRAPAKIVWRTIRGMIPHKTARGAAALERLKVFDGVPPPYDKMKRMIVPAALRILRVKDNRRVTVLGDLAKLVGWKHSAAVEKLETKRKTRATAFYARKKALLRIRTKARQDASAKLPKQHAEILLNGGFA